MDTMTKSAQNSRHSHNLTAFELACILSELGPRDGCVWTAICVWCLHRLDPQEQCIARRANAISDCLRCAYTGEDVFVALLPIEEGKHV